MVRRNKRRGRRATSPKGKGKFKYRRRSADDIKKAAKNSRGITDPMFSGDFNVWVPKGGGNWVRILPPTFEGFDEFGLFLYVHYGVGPDELSYLCPAKHKGETCPLCEERKKADKAGDDDYVKELNYTRRELVWIIDRNAKDREQEPVLWAMPWSVRIDLNALTYDKQTEDPLWIDDPEEGYDIEFTRDGIGMKTKYKSLLVARRQSPLHPDPGQMEAWLEFVTENPLSEAIELYSVEHIQAAFAGVAEDDDEDERFGKDIKRAVRADDDSYDDDEDEDDEESLASDEDEDEDEDSTTAEDHGLDVGVRVRFEDEKWRIKRVARDGMTLTLENKEGEIAKGVAIHEVDLLKKSKRRR